jgi:phage/plasmid-like protein (TIGR03299 family)
MSAEIEVNDVVQLGSNTQAWWGFQTGHLWQGLLSPLRCWVEGTGAREMFEVPLVGPDGEPFEGYKGIVGTYSNGNRTGLSVVGENYGLMTDQKFFEILEQVYNGRAVVETAGTLRNGRRVWCLVKRDQWSVTTGDKVMTYDLWVNRHDGSGCWELHRTNVRVVCSNTWQMAIGNGRNRVIGIAHRANILDHVKSALATLEVVQKNEAAERAKVQALAAAKFSYSEAESFFKVLVGLRDGDDKATRMINQVNSMNELFVRGTGNEGKTRWDAFNAVTEFVDHSRTIRLTNGRSQSEARFESSLFGSGDAVKAKAFELLTA